MSSSIYYVEKVSGTFADNLVALGLAEVLNRIAEQRAHIWLEDGGSIFLVHCEPALQPEWVDHSDFFTALPFLITYDRKLQKKVIKGTTLSVNTVAEGDGRVDYEAEKANNETYFAWLRALPDADRRLAVRGELRGPAGPHPDWDLFRAVNPAALQAYNSLLAEWWQARPVFGELLRLLLRLFSSFPNPVDQIEADWNKLCKTHGLTKPKQATAIQLLNPAQGKGVNSPKATWRAPGNISGFWLIEWLKLVGLRYGGITRQVRGVKDRKTYVLAPMRFDWDAHTAVMAEFKSTMVGSASAVKLDVLAALRYTLALLKHYEIARTDDPLQAFFGHSVRDLVQGFHTAFYKDMGNAIATMNIAAINLPDWVRPQDRANLPLLRGALEENLIIVRSLDETRGDQFDLLCLYRDFLSANNLTPFFAFTTAYSSYLIRQLERRQFARPFTTTTLEVIFMNSDDRQQRFSEIVQNEGFRNIAYAIRHSTVIPQSRKARGERPVVDVRYGLGQQLTRKAAYPADFLAELAEFIQLYNAENGQLRENKRNPFRKNVTTADLDAVTELVDQFGSKVVCNMLVAYGYARPPYTGTDTEQEPGIDVELPAGDDESGEEAGE